MRIRPHADKDVEQSVDVGAVQVTGESFIELWNKLLQYIQFGTFRDWADAIRSSEEFVAAAQDLRAAFPF